jgi:hypothetical protein
LWSSGDIVSHNLVLFIFGDSRHGGGKTIGLVRKSVNVSFISLQVRGVGGKPLSVHVQFEDHRVYLVYDFPGTKVFLVPFMSWVMVFIQHPVAYTEGYGMAMLIKPRSCCFLGLR